MNPRLALIIAAEHQRDLERAAGCCTPLAEHRRAGRRLRVAGRVRGLARSRRPRVAEPAVCCASGSS